MGNTLAGSRLAGGSTASRLADTRWPAHWLAAHWLAAHGQQTGWDAVDSTLAGRTWAGTRPAHTLGTAVVFDALRAVVGAAAVDGPGSRLPNSSAGRSSWTRVTDSSWPPCRNTIPWAYKITFTTRRFDTSVSGGQVDCARFPPTYRTGAPTRVAPRYVWEKPNDTKIQPPTRGCPFCFVLGSLRRPLASDTSRRLATTPWASSSVTDPANVPVSPIGKFTN